MAFDGVTIANVVSELKEKLIGGRLTKPSTMTAPNFCMLLRKHLQNGRIIDISQPGLERIVRIQIEHLDEMGDLRQKTLIIEIMGKHSNIIFCNDDNMIIDSIKHISAAVSSLREVLPGKPYFIAGTQDKLDALTVDFDFPPNRSRLTRLCTAALQVFLLSLPRSSALRPGLTENCLWRP